MLEAPDGLVFSLFRDLGRSSRSAFGVLIFIPAGSLYRSAPGPCAFSSFTGRGPNFNLGFQLRQMSEVVLGRELYDVFGGSSDSEKRKLSCEDAASRLMDEVSSLG